MPHTLRFLKKFLNKEKKSNSVKLCYSINPENKNQILLIIMLSFSWTQPGKKEKKNTHIQWLFFCSLKQNSLIEYKKNIIFFFYRNWDINNCIRKLRSNLYIVKKRTLTVIYTQNLKL